jgi:hypothetical protein
MLAVLLSFIRLSITIINRDMLRSSPYFCRKGDTSLREISLQLVVDFREMRGSNAHASTQGIIR